MYLLFYIDYLCNVCNDVADFIPGATPVGGKGAVVQELVPVVGRRRRVVAHVAALAVVLLLELLAGRDRHALRLEGKS